MIGPVQQASKQTKNEKGSNLNNSKKNSGEKEHQKVKGQLDVGVAHSQIMQQFKLFPIGNVQLENDVPRHNSKKQILFAGH